MLSLCCVSGPGGSSKLEPYRVGADVLGVDSKVDSTRLVRKLLRVLSPHGTGLIVGGSCTFWRGIRRRDNGLSIRGMRSNQSCESSVDRHVSVIAMLDIYFVSMTGGCVVRSGQKGRSITGLWEAGGRGIVPQRVL
jgi:hypothetical protein